MRKLGCLIACLAFISGSAHAQTYLLTYTGKPLRVTPGYLPIPGATKIVVTFQIPADEMPGLGGCTRGETYFEPSSYSDGANTLASLEAAGYALNYVLYFCRDSTGKKIVSWVVGISGQTGERNPYNYFQMETEYNYMTYPNVKDSVEQAIGLPIGTYYDNSARTGNWKVKFIKAAPTGRVTK